ncbi:unnamed protein product, partial [marine sediment metagenome]
RSSPSFDYKGASLVQKPDDKSSTFKSFSKFIAAAEEKGEIKTEIIEGFTEIFLPDEDPQVESELSPNLKDVIEKEDWKRILKIIIKAYTDIKSEDRVELKFVYLHNCLRTAKKKGLLQYSNRKLANTLSALEDIGFLVPQRDGKYTLSEDHEEKFEIYVENVTL